MVYLIVSIDVEPDCTPSWHYSDPLSFVGVKIGIKERLQPLFRKYNIIPTYLINNVVLEDEESVGVFKSLRGNFELGAHLHPEFIDPDKTVLNYPGSKGEAYCCSYSPDVEFKKIKNITELFQKKFGYRPVSFRAGRFGVNENTLKSLAELGYKVDTSITPHIFWSDKTLGKTIDYSNVDEQPYWINEKLLEVPVSIIKKYRFSVIELLKSGIGIRHYPKFNEILWLRPTFSNLNQLCKIFTVLTSNKDKSNIVLNLMFHNVEVMPALSPYSQTEIDCKKYLRTLERFFDFCKQANVKSINLSSLHNIIE